MLIQVLVLLVDAAVVLVDRVVLLEDLQYQVFHYHLSVQVIPLRLLIRVLLVVLLVPTMAVEAVVVLVP